MTIMIAYLFIPVISIYDDQPCSFTGHSMLDYLYEKMIYLSTGFTKTMEK